MKKLLLMFAAVGMLFTACNKETDCGHEFIEVDHSKDLVGTWTCLEADYAAAFVFNADGTAFTTGVENGEYWENVQVNWKVVNNKLTLNYGDNTSETLLEIIPGEYLSISDKNGDRRKIYKYCANDLADEIIGMWVCNDGLPEEENDMVIMTYSEDGKMTMTTQASTFIPDDFVNQVCDYKVVGDLLFKLFPKENFAEGGNPYLVSRVIYTPNGTSLGDVLMENQHTPTENGVMELTFSFLRVKQNLELANKNYDYSDIYVSNVKGIDKDIEFMGYTVNFAKMDGSMLDKMLKNILFNISFPDANTINYTYHYTNGKQTFDAPIVVEGNKLTVKMSEKVPTLKDVVFYVFQDADNCQLHIYMHKTAFVNFYTNMQAQLMEATNDQFDITNAEQVNAIYNSINEAVETINLSLVMKAAK